MTGSIVSGLLAVAFGVVAARVQVRDDVDKFIEDLVRQSFWASMAAIFAAIAAILQAVHYFISR
jgi:hypothetical protein